VNIILFESKLTLSNGVNNGKNPAIYTKTESLKTKLSIFKTKPQQKLKKNTTKQQQKKHNTQSINKTQQNKNVVILLQIIFELNNVTFI